MRLLREDQTLLERLSAGAVHDLVQSCDAG
jgi:hypothetical protein